MKATSILSSSFVLALAATTCAWSQRDNRWDRYQPRTLRSIIDQHLPGLVEMSSPKDEFFLSTDDFPSHAKLVYLAKSRPMPPNKRELLDAWIKLFKEHAPKPELFATEVLFEEGKNQFWIAVQKPVLDALPGEVQKGQSFYAYVVFVGEVKKAGEAREWLFLMHEFDTP